MKSKNDELKDLVNEGKFEELFKELDKFFGKTHDTYNNLSNEYINRPNNYVQAGYTEKLKIFINKYFEPNDKDEPDYYKALCELDFKLQTTHFQNIYKYKKIAAFLLHGETDEQGNDINWLCNQLIYQEGLANQKPIIIDFSLKRGRAFDVVLEEFCETFAIKDKSKPIDEIRYKLSKRLEAGNLVCIIKTPECLLNDQLEIKRLFEEFLILINQGFYKPNPKNYIVFLFIESKLVNYHLNEMNYFFSYNDDTKTNYSKNAKNCQDFKIIDLAPIGKINESDICNWIDWTQPNPELYEKVQILENQEGTILQCGNKPYQVIKQICQKLNIEFNQSWIQIK